MESFIEIDIETTPQTESVVTLKSNIQNEIGVIDKCVQDEQSFVNIKQKNSDNQEEQNQQTQENIQAVGTTIDQIVIKVEDPKNQLNDQQCLICYQQEEQLAKLRRPLDCKHQFCEMCLNDYLEIFIKLPNCIYCPENGCYQQFTRDILNQYLKLEDIQKYEKFISRKKILNKSYVRFCIKPDCEYLVKKQINKNHGQCECGQTIYFSCGQEWHLEKSCEQVIDKGLSDYINKNFLLNCPQCKFIVEKVSGCNIITCPYINFIFIKKNLIKRICRADWCWLCGKHITFSHDVFGCTETKYARLIKFQN